MEIAQDEWDFDRVSGLTTHKLEHQGKIIQSFSNSRPYKIHQTSLFKVSLRSYFAKNQLVKIGLEKMEKLLNGSK